MDVTIIEPTSQAELSAFDQLNWDYLAFLRAIPGMREIVDAFYSDENYRTVLAKPYARPTGLKRLAMLGDEAVGCGTIQTLAPGDAEIKRVYLAPAARGAGAGRALMDHLVVDCREMGFRRILMDTGKALVAAQTLYDTLGFQRRGPYQDVPPNLEGELVFFEMAL